LDRLIVLPPLRQDRIAIIGPSFFFGRIVTFTLHVNFIDLSLTLNSVYASISLSCSSQIMAFLIRFSLTTD